MRSAQSKSTSSLVAALALVTAASLVSGQDRESLRHIVVFVADDHGQDTGAYGNPVIQTPHLDALAADGVRFTHAFATTASCSASRSVILTGLHNHRTGQYGHTHDYHKFASYGDLQSLPVLLQRAGYRTASAGKLHVAPDEVYRFERRIEGNPRNAAEMAENARAFITAPDARPFFLYMATYDPHRGGPLPSDPPSGIAAPIDSFGNGPDGYAGIRTVTYDPADVIVPPWLPDTAATRAELAQYYQSVSRLDQGFGRLIEVLKQAGVYEQTLLVYLSDHGIAMPGAKTTTYEPGLRSPLIVRHPDVDQRGTVSSAMISWVDITPTLLDYAGVDPPTYRQHVTSREVRGLIDLPETHGLHGRSFLPVLESADGPSWDEVYASHTFHEIQMYYPMRVVRGRRYKLIWNLANGLTFPFATDLWAAATWQQVYRQGPDALYGQRTVKNYMHRPPFELYDLESDPWEANNLADNPDYADLLSQYKTKLRAFQERTSDPWALKWTYE